MVVVVSTLQLGHSMTRLFVVLFLSSSTQITVSRPTTTTTTTERTTRSALWLGEVKFTDREGRRLGDWDLGFSGPSLPSLPSKKDLAIAAIDLAGLFPIFVTGGVIVVFITMFR